MNRDELVRNVCPVTGERNIERTYATHFVLTEEVRQKMARKAVGGDGRSPQNGPETATTSPLDRQ
jgi:hypothetical protein